MTTQAWGDLQKSITDPSTIDEEIDLKITEHLGDPDAHLESGQSLQSHKASEIIDHLAYSIIADKIKDFEIYVEKLTTNKLLLWPSFESLDSFVDVGVGTSFLFCGGFYIESTDVSGSTFSIHTEADYLQLYHNSKLPTFETMFRVDPYNNFYAYVGFGALDEIFIGFKVVDSVVYACIRDYGDEYLTELVGIDPTNDHSYRWNVIDSSTIIFYVDEVELHTQTTNIPADDQFLTGFNISITPTENAFHSVTVTELKYFQDR